MNHDVPRPSFFHRLGNLIEKIIMRIVITGAVLGGTALVIGWIWLLIVGNLGNHTPNEANPASLAPSQQPATPITWTYAGSECADGWDSPSIGKRGACSHHGGVVTYYVSTPGGYRTLCGPRYQPRTYERAVELATAGGMVTCDWDQ
jgi:hypothetical protein